MPLQATSGAASYDAFGGGVPAVPQYIEDVFSTWLYTGNGTSQTITNGIDLSTKGGLVWTKVRATSVQDHALYDTARGTQYKLRSNSTAAQSNTTSGANADFKTFNTTGYTLGTPYSTDDVNGNSYPYVSWTFRKQPKFFDIVTYTGNGNNRTIAHNLGSVPGCIIVKSTSVANPWPTYHRSMTNSSVSYVNLNETSSRSEAPTYWNSTNPTASVFSIGTSNDVNQNGTTYVAYLFAHDAGGFGLAGTDNVISCGSYTGNGSTTGPVVTLGYEPQWVMVKRTDTTSNWTIFDTMRGMSQTTANLLYPNVSDDEGIGTQGWVVPNATGFQLAITQSSVNASGGTYIYIAIRRGPMKVPTSGTSVFLPTKAANDTSAITTNFPVDLFTDWLTDSVLTKPWVDRLRGSTKWLTTTSTAIEASTFTAVLDSNVSYTPNFMGASNIISYAFRRSPNFFDIVCYTGTGSNTTFTHNLGVVPDLIIVKRRDTTGAWDSYCSALANTEYVTLNVTSAKATGATRWNSTTPTSSVFSVGTSTTTNASAGTYVAYLFATCAGVSKVAGYTGTGTTLQIDCGFTAGARFVLIKRTDSTGDWYVWDSARGIVAGNDPYLLLNSTAAEVTSTDYVDTYNAGFEISSTAPAAINASGGTFIFLAIA